LKLLGIYRIEKVPRWTLELMSAVIQKYGLGKILEAMSDHGSNMLLAQLVKFCASVEVDGANM